MMKKTSTRAFGFTLVEMTVVLVIIGLVVGSILAGQSLIKSAQLKATMKQITDLTAALDTFQDKYSGLPGDLVNANAYWSTATPGNGNGLIEAAVGTCTIAPTQLSDPDCGVFTGEQSQFFIQLGLAGLTKTYNGSTTVDAGYPAIKLHPKQGMYVAGPYTISSASNMGMENYMTTGRVWLEMIICDPTQFNGSSAFNDCAIFTPEEAWDMDTKMDDGQPLSGQLLGESYNTPCLTGAAYNLGISTVACNIVYKLR